MTEWIELLERNYGPSQPQLLRIVVASALGQSWRTLLQCCDDNSGDVVAMKFWLLLVELLQDYNVDCRNEAAKCVAHMMSHIHGLYISV